MKKAAYVLASALFFGLPAQAGTFWFPLNGFYPYSSGNNITAVPDLNQLSEVVRSRMNEYGRRAKGCLDGVTGGSCIGSWNSTKVWGYKKDSVGLWELDGVPYSGNKNYLYYDNHRGYDFAVAAGTEVRTVEDGTFCGIYTAEGQVCIKHILPSGTYRTYYTHMNIATWVKSLNEGDWVGKWANIGNVSNVSQYSVGVHLHFATYKYDSSCASNPTQTRCQERLGNVGPGWIVVDPYGLKNGVGGTDIEPYLWQ